MSQPTQSPGDAGVPAEPPAWTAEPPAWTAEPPAWTAEPPAWTVQTPPWPSAQPFGGWAPPAAPGAQPAAESPAAGRRKRPLLLAAVAIAGVLAGAVATALLVTTAFLSAAEDIGRGMSEGLGSDIGRSVGEGLTESMQDSLADLPLPEEGFGWYGTPPPAGPVEEFPAVEPGPLGPDPVLDSYAQSCFGGDLQACDDLWYESPPLSDYEDYAATCGGRVKRDALMTCTDLD